MKKQKTKSMSKRLWSIALCTALVFTVQPGVMLKAYAAGVKPAAIRLDGDNGFGMAGKGTNNVYFGDYNGVPINWRLLSTNKNGDSFKDSNDAGYNGNGLFLLSEKELGTAAFKADKSSNIYQGSDLQAYCNTTLYGSCFSKDEKAAILSTVKSAANDPVVAGFWGSVALDNDKLFSLSMSEVTNSSYGFKSGAFNQADNARRINKIWHLRTPNSDTSVIAGVVTRDGSMTNGSVEDANYVRPAFNMNLTSVFFASAAQGGKSASGMDSGMAAVPATAPATWKLTLLDKNRNFNVASSSATIESGQTLSVSYTGAKSGANEYVSVMLVDADGNALYYGRVKAVPESGAENGTADIVIPAYLNAGSYQLKVFSEQYNGDNKTDYASAFSDVALTVTNETIAPTVQSITPDSGTSPASLAITFNELMDTETAGTVTLDNGAAASSPKWSNDGKTVTYTLSSLTGSTYNLSVSGFKDKVGNIMAEDTARGLAVVPGAAPAAWRLMLLDKARNFSVTTPTATSESGKTLSISYTGAKSGTNEYVSTMLVDATGNVLHYGRVKAVADSGAENGSADIVIPANLKAGSYKLKVFSEQYNGDNNTGFASAFSDVALTMNAETIAPTVQSVTPDSGTGANPSSLSITFSEPMDTVTTGTVTLSNGAAAGSPKWSNNDKTVTYTLSGLTYSTVYNISISGFKDKVDNIMAVDTTHSYTTGNLTYIDENGAMKTTTATKIADSSTYLGTGWYVVSSDVSMNTMSIQGNVNLILADGCKLKVIVPDLEGAAVDVREGNSLTIYGQSLGTGQLIAIGNEGAGIGSRGVQVKKVYNSGTIIINGGTITAGSGRGAGIGGGYFSSCGTIVINGGTVNATSSRCGAGIGSGNMNDNNGSITINGGIVTASGGSAGSAGIGGGWNGNGGKVTITGGTVKAVGTPVRKDGNGTVLRSAIDIGGGKASGGSVTAVITGGTVSGSIESPPTNGSANGNSEVKRTKINLIGVSAATSVTALTFNTAYNYGTKDLFTDAAGNLFLYLPSDVVVKSVEVAGRVYRGGVPAGATDGTLSFTPPTPEMPTPSSNSSSKNSSSGANSNGKMDQASISGSAGTSANLPVRIDTATRSASVELSAAQGASLVKGENMKIDIPSISETTGYNLTLPIKNLTTNAGGTLTIKSDAADMTLPANMLSSLSESSGQNVTASIQKMEIAALSDTVKEAVGNRPVLQLTLKVDGKQVEWNNPAAPVKVSIPYKPTADELKNPESIIIWYIDGSGKAVCVPNGHYDAASGKVTFKTTHFSLYSVGYNPVSFNDVKEDVWYSDAVSLLAARNIVSGTGNNSFRPEVKLTRGEFIVMLMRAYGIEPKENAKDNFKDAGNTYYTGYLAEAKRLGISAGVSDNLFAPKKNITRQEMFTLMYSTLKIVGELPDGDSGKRITDFTDSSEIDGWANDAMTLLVETGTISGNASKLTPTSMTSRAEMAQLLYNLLSK